MRLMCEMIDYRYARYLSESKQIIHPLISRGLWRDVQIWVPAVSGPKAAGRGPVQGSLPVILKVFPLMSFVWLGLRGDPARLRLAVLVGSAPGSPASSFRHRLKSLTVKGDDFARG